MQQAETRREEKGIIPGRNEGKGPREVKPSSLISKLEPRLSSCMAPESAGQSPIFSQSSIARAWSSHRNGQVGQYLSGLFWKLGKVKC